MQFKISMAFRDNVLNFWNLVSLLIIEEKILGEESFTENKNMSKKVIYSNSGRGKERGHGCGQGGGYFGNLNGGH